MPADLSIGVVVIGRNEGSRLHACLRSLCGERQHVVYVDSGSTDGSQAFARSLGADVVELDLSQPFTAARARNVGWRHLMQRFPDIGYMQFVDGDCEVAATWLPCALDFLLGHPDVAVVCGRRRERYPQSSIYNQLCDLEWDTPIGEALACGGDALMRVEALQASGGYRDELIAGEEPELCVRIRAAGWKVWRIDAEMTLHDAAMRRFSQWWRRSVRAGHAFAEGSALHGAPPERHWVRETRSARVWTFGPLVLAVLMSPVLGAWAWLVLLVYPAQCLRLFMRLPGPARVRLLRAVFLVLGKFAEMQGQLRYLGQRLMHRRAEIIEYK